MNDWTDQQLLNDYVRHHSEAAFAEIVRRHVNIVHSAALRMVRDPDTARDVTQGVFLALARDARLLARHPVLSGWLHCTARNLASKAVRSEVRRRVREQEAAMNLLSSSESDAHWDEIAPCLDDALGEMAAPDREALLLRYFERKSAREMAAILHTTEDAAQKRVNRAVERLRELISKRGIAVGVGSLAVVVSTNAVQAAPAGLAVTISSATAVFTSSTTAVVATKAIAMTTIQKSLVAVIVVAAVGAGIYEAREATSARDQFRNLQQQHSDLTARVGKLQQERDEATNRITSLADELSRAKGDNLEMARLRAEVTRLKAAPPAQPVDPADDEMKSWLVRTQKLKQYLSNSPAARIPEMRLLDDSAFSSASRSTLNTERDYLSAMSNLRSSAEFKFITTLLNPALTEYAKANNGQFPTDLSQLKPYFPAPVEDAILDRWQIAPANTVRTDFFGDPIITTKAPMDADFDPRYAVGLKGFASAGKDTAGHNGWGVIPPELVMESAARAYRDANNGQTPTDVSQMIPYLTTPEQQAAYQKFMQWREKR